MIPSACRACAPRARSPVSLGGGARPLTGFTRPPRGGRPRREEVKLPRGASQVGPSRRPAETPRPPLCRRMNPGSNFFAREAPPPPPPTHLQRRHPASQVNPRLRRGGGVLRLRPGTPQGCEPGGGGPPQGFPSRGPRGRIGAYAGGEKIPHWAPPGIGAPPDWPARGSAPGPAGPPGPPGEPARGPAPRATSDPGVADLGGPPGPRSGARVSQ